MDHNGFNVISVLPPLEELGKRGLVASPGEGEGQRLRRILEAAGGDEEETEKNGLAAAVVAAADSHDARALLEEVSNLPGWISI